MDAEQLELSHIVTKWHSHVGKTLSQLLTKLNLYFPYDTAIPLPGTYPRETKTYIHTNSYIQILMATLFIIIKNKKQLICALISKWTNKSHYIHTMEY